MTIIGGVEIINEDKLKILDRIWVLHIDDSLAGDFVVWADANSFMRIYATPNFEVDGVPVQIDYDCYNIAGDSYLGKIDSYDHYKQIVKEMAEKLLTNLPMCKCVEKREAIEIKGWDFSICGYCNKKIGKNSKDENILTHEKVVEDLNKILENYFEEKAHELKLQHGDISPDQSLEFDNAIEKIADIIIQWAIQNRETHANFMR